ncbi:hypothetical protein V3470_07595 [Flavobacterium oreochromis]|uniref:Uncharacterized protein n=1 Tax=Flavobacterium oreochromis TaxID=2906078 RepID=A0ABW8P8Y4_9FLAO|nr:hypothetical protein [Flavobacterium oreochromis]OWP75894.1 hypothetical protein BWG23_09490 [Flavobacterium oreochromis]
MQYLKILFFFIRLFTSSYELIQNPNNDQYDEEFNLFLFAILAIGIVVSIFIIIIGIVLVLLILFAISALITMGALSTSLIIGLNKKSFTKGFKTFAMLICTLFSTVFGTLGFYIFNRIVHWYSNSTAIISGLVTGLVSGILFGLLATFTIQKISNYLKNKLKTSM